MAKEKNAKQKKSSKGILLPLILGLVSLFASWYYWPKFLTSFMKYYLPNFHSAINPMFVLVIYLFSILLAVFFMARLFKSFYLFWGAFLPIAVYLGYSDWTAHEKTLKYLNANELLLTLFAIFESGHGK
jgi:hypothetical protein